MKARREDLLGLLKWIGLTEPEEIDCDEFLARVGTFIESHSAEHAPPIGFEDVVQHLRVCPECLEEYRALYEALRGEG